LLLFGKCRGEKRPPCQRGLAAKQTGGFPIARQSVVCRANRIPPPRAARHLPLTREALRANTGKAPALIFAGLQNPVGAGVPDGPKTQQHNVPPCFTAAGGTSGGRPLRQAPNRQSEGRDTFAPGKARQGASAEGRRSGGGVFVQSPLLIRLLFALFFPTKKRAIRSLLLCVSSENVGATLKPAGFARSCSRRPAAASVNLHKI